MYWHINILCYNKYKLIRENKKEIKLFDPLETIKEATDEFGSSSNISTGGIERFSFKPNIKNFSTNQIIQIVNNTDNIFFSF